MPCYPIKVPGGHGYVCTGRERRKSCVQCGRRADRLCDWKLKGKRAGKTCSRSVCSSCSVQPAPDKDLCPTHARAWDSHPANAQRRTS